MLKEIKGLLKGSKFEAEMYEVQASANYLQVASTRKFTQTALQQTKPPQLVLSGRSRQTVRS